MLLFRRRCIKETIENPRTDLSCELKPETGLVFGKSPKPYSRRSKGHLDRGFHRGHSWTNIHPTPVPQHSFPFVFKIHPLFFACHWISFAFLLYDRRICTHSVDISLTYSFR